MRGVLILLCLIPLSIYAQKTFVHPGLSHKQSDLDRIKYMVEAQINPWYSTYNLLKSESSASYDYTIRGNDTMTVISNASGNVIHYNEFSSDALAAYLNSLMWIITGDSQHADKCVEIFNSWQNITNFVSSGTDALNAGRIIWKMLEAAEIIKSTYSGWSESDIQKFKDMLVYPGYSKTTPETDGTFYWRMYMGDPGRHGNQDLFGWRGIMAMGVFLDNETMYKRALNYVKGESHPDGDLSYQSGPPIITDTPISSYTYYDYYGGASGYSSDSADYGYDGVLKNYIWENGQCQEASRDQDHTILGVGMYASLAEIAWNQGDDLWGLLDNRILKGYEYTLRYNVSYNYSFNDQSSSWEPTVENGDFIERRDRTGRWTSKAINPYYEGNFESVSRGNFKSNKRPIYQMTLAHYNVRQGLSLDSMEWTFRADSISYAELGYYGKNGWSLDHLGWGALTAHRPDLCAGDPGSIESGDTIYAMHLVADTVEAEDYDFFTGNGELHTYHDLTSSNDGGFYRTDGVDISECSTGGYKLSSLENGEWLNYTVYVSTAGEYYLNFHYKPLKSGGIIRVECNGVDKTGQLTLPNTSDYINSFSEWKSWTPTTKIILDAGVQNLRVYIEGESNAFELDKFSITSSLVEKVSDDTDLGDWSIQSSGSGTISEGHLNVTMAYQASNSKYRADIWYNYGSDASKNITLIPSEDVYLAIKFIGNSPDGNLKLEMLKDTDGTLSWLNTKWNSGSADGYIKTKSGNYIYYFDLTKDPEYPGTSVEVRRMHFTIADAVVEPYSYTVDWISTFSELKDLVVYADALDDGTGDFDEDVTSYTNEYVIKSGTLAVDQNTNVDDITIKDSGELLIEAGATLTVANLTNYVGNDGLILESNADNSAKLDCPTIGIQATLKQLLKADKWHYVGLPFSDSYKVEDVYSGLWVASINEGSATSGSNAGWYSLTANDDILPCTGYSLYHNLDTIISVAGTLNSGDVDVQLAYNNEGWNLIGNPYPTSIDWTVATTGNVNNAVYVYNNGTYGSYVNGTGSNGQTQYIAPMQGFFVQANAISPTLTFGNSSKSTESITFKSATVNSVVRLTISDNAGRKDETVIVKRANSSVDFEGDFDARKLIISTSEVPQIYTATDKEYSINMIPSLEKSVLIPLKILTKKDGVHILSLSLENLGEKLPVLLLNGEKRLIADLRKGDCQLELKADELGEYFIGFNRVAAKLKKLTGSNVRIEVVNKMIELKGLGQKSRVEVYNLSGQKMCSVETNDGFARMKMSEKGIFIIKVYSLNGFNFRGKVIID